jgi:shikimate kinase
MPGSGKSTLAKRLAKKLHLMHIDLDKEIVRKTTNQVEQIFEKEGEQYFREIESNCLKNTLSYDDIIVSTGGGCASYKDNMDWMNKHGLTVYLEADLRLLIDRIRQSTSTRPLFLGLNNEELMHKLQQLYDIRVCYYRQSKLVVKVPVNSLKSLVDQVKNSLLD